MVIYLQEIRAEREFAKYLNEATTNPNATMTLGELAAKIKADGKVIKGTVKLT
jgi:hypothetical protein